MFLLCRGAGGGGHATGQIPPPLHLQRLPYPLATSLQAVLPKAHHPDDPTAYTIKHPPTHPYPPPLLFPHVCPPLIPHTPLLCSTLLDTPSSTLSSSSGGPPIPSAASLQALMQKLQVLAAVAPGSDMHTITAAGKVLAGWVGPAALMQVWSWSRYHVGPPVELVC